MNIEQRLDREISTLVRTAPKEEKQRSSKLHFTFEQFLEDKMLIIWVIQQGVSYSLFDSIRNFTPFSELDWARLLDISTKSLVRYKQSSKKFKPLQSEKIIEMAEVTNVGKDVFGDIAKLKLWLDTPNFALGGRRPMDLLKDSYGKELVISELTRIKHGILA